MRSYVRIDYALGFGLERDDESLITPIALAHLLILLEAGRGISAEICGSDGVCPLDDLGSGAWLNSLLYTYNVL